jgi:NAD(P)-dependent dehydrogenase (short-subunit alcohol dehydrogenase family)
MMEVLADEYDKSNIRFNCINPGPTQTPLRAKAFPAENRDNVKTAKDIMSLYLYLMDNKISSENGLTLSSQ